MKETLIMLLKEQHKVALEKYDEAQEKKKEIDRDIHFANLRMITLEKLLQFVNSMPADAPSLLANIFREENKP